jgi:hypothetical protein
LSIIQGPSRKKDVQADDQQGPEVIEKIPNAELAFESQKEALRSALVLKTPNYSEPFMLQMVASGKGLRAVLTQ